MDVKCLPQSLSTLFLTDVLFHIYLLCGQRVTCAMARVWKSKVDLQKSTLSLYHVGPDN